MQFPYIKNEIYQLSSPVFHVGSYIKKNLDSNGQIKDRMISIVFKNISEIQIEAIEGLIHSFNSFNEALSIDSFNQIEIPNFTPGSLYGDLLFFNVNKDAVSFKVEIKRIKYFNQDIQIYNENSFYNFVKEDVVENMDLKKFILNKLDSNIEYSNDLYQDEFLYRCICGSINLKSNSNCYHCKISKDTYEKLLTDEKMNLILKEDVQSFLNDRLFVKYKYFDLYENEIREFLSKSNTKNLVKEIKSIQKNYDILSPVIKNKINEEINIKKSGDALIKRIESVESQLLSEKKEKEELARINNKKLAKLKAIEDFDACILLYNNKDNQLALNKFKTIKNLLKNEDNLSELQNFYLNLFSFLDSKSIASILQLASNVELEKMSNMKMLEESILNIEQFIIYNNNYQELSYNNLNIENEKKDNLQNELYSVKEKLIIEKRKRKTKKNLLFLRKSVLYIVFWNFEEEWAFFIIPPFGLIGFITAFMSSISFYFANYEILSGITVILYLFIRVVLYLFNYKDLLE